MGIFFSQVEQDSNDLTEEKTVNEEEKINEINPDEKGAYIFQDEEGRIYRFLYFKLGEIEMKKALPLTYQEDSERNYLLVTFDPEGSDYLAQQSQEKMLEYIETNKMTNLLTTSWEEIKDNYNITEIDYQNLVDFANEQLKI